MAAHEVIILMVHVQQSFTSYYQLYKNGDSSITPQIAITIEDIERAMVKKSLNVINPEHVNQLEELIVTDENICDLRVIASLRHLKSLSLWDTRITSESLFALAHLNQLQELGLDGTQITDLAPIAQLKGLLKLSLNDTPVSDLTPLKSLRGLLSLHMSGCLQLKDISPLTHLSQLLELALDETQVADISPIYSLKNLKCLVIEESAVSPATLRTLREKMPHLDPQAE